MIAFKEFFVFLSRIAPFELQEDWDRSGVWFSEAELLKSVGIGLEIEDFSLEEVEKIDAFVVHHPPFLKEGSELAPLKRNLLAKLNQAKKSLIVMHTNADKCRDSFVDLILEKIGVRDGVPLKKAFVRKAKIATFIPPLVTDDFLSFLKEKEISRIGFYDACAFMTEGVGHFCPDRGASPFIGKKEECNKEAEIRLELEADIERIEEIVEGIEGIHPYEEPIIEIYEMKRYVKGAGLGRVFSYEGSIDELVESFRNLNIGVEDYQKAGERAGKVVFVPGSGRNLFRDVIKYSADTFVSGDLGYHEKKDLLQAGINLVQLNHGSVERYFVEWLKNRLVSYFGNQIKIISKEVL